MKYEIREEAGKYCIYPQGMDKAEGCYDTSEEAKRRMTTMADAEKKDFHKLAQRVAKWLKRKQFERAADGTGFKMEGNHWFVTWTNNFEDREGETFSAKAIEEYVTRVNGALVPYPELWVWHGGANTRIGMAEMVGTMGHFGVAAGTFDDTPHAVTAKSYFRKNAANTTVSHGFTYPPYALKDGVYGTFNTFEISLLERGAEANLFTALEGVKMALNSKQDAYLRSIFGDDFLTQIVSDADERGEALKAVGVNYKDFARVSPPDLGEDQPDTAPIDVNNLIKAVLQLTSDNDALTTAMARKAKETTDTVASLAALVTGLKADVEAFGVVLDARPRSATSERSTQIEEAAIPSSVPRERSAQAKFYGVT